MTLRERIEHDRDLIAGLAELHRRDADAAQTAGDHGYLAGYSEGRAISLECVRESLDHILLETAGVASERAETDAPDRYDEGYIDGYTNGYAAGKETGSE